MELKQQKLEAALLEGRERAYLPFQVHCFETVSSTNQILWDLLNSGAEAGCTVIATQQTAGRGQWGRQWISPMGGLYISVAISPKLAASNSYQITLATAWGIAKQLRSCGIPVEIKWPNDLVLTSMKSGAETTTKRKLGGILTETKIHGELITQAVIGVGINWANPVPETGINLEKWQAGVDPKPISSLEMLSAKVLLGIESGIQCLFNEGVNILLSRYLELLTNIGDRVHVNNFAGTVVGVTTTGDLRICMETQEPLSVSVPEIYRQPGTISLGYIHS